MKNGICVKCNSEEIYVDNTGSHRTDLMIGLVHRHPLQLYICADCGFLEFYAHTSFGTENIKEEFEKVKK